MRGVESEELVNASLDALVQEMEAWVEQLRQHKVQPCLLLTLVVPTAVTSPPACNGFPTHMMLQYRSYAAIVLN